MKISVIMPCHNCGPWISAALRSVAAQKYPAHEIVVVNDNSTDDSLAQIEASGVPVKLLHTKYGNAAAARNAGIREATGDWIAFLDADDCWEPEHLGSFGQVMSSGGEIVAYMANATFFRENGEEVTNVARWGWATEPIRLNGEQFVVNYTELPYFCHCTVIASRARLIEIGGYNEAFRYRHDIEMFLRLVAGKQWCYNPRREGRMLLRESGNISSSRLECSVHMMRAFKENRELYSEEIMTPAVRRQARVLMGLAIREANVEQYRDCYKFARQSLGGLDRVKYALIGPVVRILLTQFRRRADSCKRKLNTSTQVYNESTR